MVCFIGGEKWMDRKKGRGKVERRYKILLFGNKKKKGGENWWSQATFPLEPTKNKSPQINKNAKTGAYSPNYKKSILPNYFMLM